MNAQERLGTDRDGASAFELAEIRRWNYELDTPFRPPHEVAELDATGAEPSSEAAFEEQFESAETFEAGVARPTVRRGSRGQAVRELQLALGRAGWQLVADGVFGPATDAAVRELQRTKGLAVDGIVGPQTWAALQDSPAAPARPPGPRPPQPQRRPGRGGGATWSEHPDQVAFREAVLARHIERSRRRKKMDPQRDLRPDELGTVPGSEVRMAKPAAATAGRLLSAALRALEAARNAGDPDALRTTGLGVGSGYRDRAHQERVWRNAFKRYYKETAAARAGLAGGAHGDAAVTYMLETYGIPWRVAAPGYSNHQSGIAIDFVQRRTRGNEVRISTAKRAVAAWQRTWFFKWLGANAASHGFQPYSKEPWHWEFRSGVTREAEFDEGDSESAESAFELDVDESPFAVEADVEHEMMPFEEEVAIDGGLAEAASGDHGEAESLHEADFAETELAEAEEALAFETPQEFARDLAASPVGEGARPELTTLDELVALETGAGTSLTDRLRGVTELTLGPTLRRGATGKAVAALQRALIALGHALAIDGSFGPNTQRAVRAFQSGAGLAADGIVGPKTKRALAAALARRGQGPSPSPAPVPAPVPSPVLARDWTQVGGDARLRHVMELLVDRYGYPVNGAAGLVGNLWAESGVLPNRIEGSRPDTPMRAPNFARQMTDFTPEQVMNRSYREKRGPRRPGIGLAQWTSPARRAGLFRHSYQGRRPGADIVYDMDAQVDYLVAELRASYAEVNSTLMRPGVTVEDAADDVVYRFEIPGSILGPDRKKLPRSDPNVQAIFRRRRGHAQRALRAYLSSRPQAAGEAFAIGELRDEMLEEPADESSQEASRLPEGPLGEADEDETFYEAYEDLSQYAPDTEELEEGAHEALNGEALEADRSLAGGAPEYVRWVQQSLNRILDGNLAVDGVMGPRTRSAVQRFQSITGLTADGIVGPKTENALIAAGATPPPSGDEGGGKGPTGPGPRAPSGQRPRTTQWIRDRWAGDQCADNRMRRVRVLGWDTPVNALTVDAFQALDRALRASGYQAERAWNYVCRKIRESDRMSLHAYGLAIDIDPPANPHRKGQAGPARFSTAPSKAGRLRDVRNRTADTVFTPEQIAAVEGIRTVDGLRIFNWGGRWSRNPDAMHFQINVSSEELQRGIAA